MMNAKPTITTTDWTRNDGALGHRLIIDAMRPNNSALSTPPIISIADARIGVVALRRLLKRLERQWRTCLDQSK